MESRRVQRVGRSTLAVSLPHEWVRTVGLKRGGLVYFEEENGDLKLSTRGEKEQPLKLVEVNADQCTSKSMLSQILVGNYILGRDIIKIVSQTRLKSEYIDEIRNTVQRLMGIAIMEETSNQVVLQSSIDVTQFPVHTLIRRLFIIASTMYNEVMEALFQSQIELARDTIKRRGEADTMFYVMIRLLDTAQQDKRMAEEIHLQHAMQIVWYRVVAQYLWLIARWSEKIADKVIALVDNQSSLRDPVLSDFLKLRGLAYSICQRAVDSIFSSDIVLATEAVEDYTSLQELEDSLQIAIFKGETQSTADSLAQISFILLFIRRIAELGSEIAEIAIIKALNKETRICKVDLWYKKPL